MFLGHSFNDFIILHEVISVKNEGGENACVSKNMVYNEGKEFLNLVNFIGE